MTYRAKPQQGTREQILDAGLKLFNEEGFQAVTASRIAKSLNISGGHLAYHFRNKNEILVCLLPRLETALQEILRWGFPHAAPYSVDRLLSILQILWDHRFFFVGQYHIASVDAEFARYYRLVRDRVTGLLTAAFDSRVREGEMMPVPSPNSTTLLAKNVWITWQDWLQEEHLLRPGQSLPCPKGVYDVILLGYCITQAYFPEGFVAGAEKELKARLG